MFNLMCQVNGSQNTKTVSWSMIILGVSVRQFLFKISINSVDMNRIVSHSECEWSSFNQLMA